MPRDIPVGNGSLLIAFDADYTIRDLYYPHVGKENHAMGNPSRFGVQIQIDNGGAIIAEKATIWDIQSEFEKCCPSGALSVEKKHED